jgi:hypothetical protein
VRIGDDNQIRWIDRPPFGYDGTMKQESGMEFQKRRWNENLGVETPGTNLNATLIGKGAGIRHAESVIAGGGQDMPLLNKWLLEKREASLKTSDSGTTVEKLHRDLEDLKRTVMRKAVTVLAKTDPRFRELAASLDVQDDGLRQADASAVGDGPTTTLINDLGVGRKLRPPITAGFESMDAQQAIELAGELSKMANEGLSEEQVRSMKSQGRSPFAEAFIADRVSGASRRSFTYTR